ncbi:MAG: SGNH/GDSL hydrolase family protein [Lachnospiraceae bacterium]|nr:SGNH/GDSL hydrolase family protein [Butyrivibrio sp.]MCM1342709.1 SGNH/GDSL hydrolase family protein [Muribaculaceae bacterium]MCM1410027.1 SGNH/GDSL hydrolase family protein [Lachnospiraceae bacterium]
MKFYHITESPIRIYGLAVADKEKRQFWRLEPHIMDLLPQYDFLGKRAAGGRVRFRTDSADLCVRMTLAQAKEDINIPLSGSAGADLYLGKGRESVFWGYVAPQEHTMEEITVEKLFHKNTQMEAVTVNLPRNDHLLSMEIGIDENAHMEEAEEYSIEKPIVFYGSSITEGGCASRVGNAYTSIVCRWLDADHYNFGFSGSARGEREFAGYIAALPEMSAFVYDYDHNAPDPKHLADTHEEFFRIVRQAHPEVPVIIMTRPDVEGDKSNAAERRDIIRRTYENALADGDRRVWFLDGGTFFGDEERTECLVDGIHPNALGFMRMAQSLYPVLKTAIKMPFARRNERKNEK